MPDPRALVTGQSDPTSYPQQLVPGQMNGAWVNGQWVPLDEPKIRANTPWESISDTTHDIYQGLASTLPGWLGDRLGLIGWGADARRLEDAQKKAEPLYGDAGAPMGFLRELPKTGLSADAIREALQGLSVADAPKIAKMLPVTEGRGDLGKILTRGVQRGKYPFAPESAERAQQMYHIGTSLPRRAEWASVLDPEMLHAFENDPELAKTFGSLWASLSNQNPVPTNTAEAAQVWYHALENPEEFPLHYSRLQQLPHQKVNLAPSKYGNVNRAFMGEPLSGPKVRPMETYMRGEGTGREVMTPDVHALYGSGVTRPSPSIAQELPHIRDLVTRTEKLKRGTLTQDELVNIWQDSLYDVLHQVAPDRRPDEIFGDFWEGARAHKGKAFQGSVKDILRDRGLLEYGAMLNPKKLLAALRDQRGWSAGALAGLAALLATHDESPVATPPPAR